MASEEREQACKQLEVVLLKVQVSRQQQEMEELCQELRGLRSELAYCGAAPVSEANHQRVVEELEGQVWASRKEMLENKQQLEAVRKEMEALQVHGREEAEEARCREMAEVGRRVRAEQDRDFLLGVLLRHGIDVRDLRRA